MVEANNGDGEETENWQKMIYRRGILYLNIASHLWQKRGKGEFVERHVGKSELAEAAAAHAPEQEVWVKAAKHFWKIKKLVRGNLAWLLYLFLQPWDKFQM